MDLNDEFELRYDFPDTRLQLWSSLFPFEAPGEQSLPKRKSSWLLIAGLGVVFIFFAFAMASTIKSFKTPGTDTTHQRRESVWSYDSQYS